MSTTGIQIKKSIILIKKKYKTNVKVVKFI
jgi:hypothetical protein